MSDRANLSVEELHARMLKKQLWIVMTKAVVPLEEVRRHLKAHLEHQIALEKAGIMYGAGPATKPGETTASFGLIIIRAKDETDARRIADLTLRTPRACVSTIFMRGHSTRGVSR